MLGGRVDENEMIAEVAKFGGRELAWFGGQSWLKQF